jgi:hypothetical protein
MSVVVAFIGAKEPTVGPDPCAADYELEVDEHADRVELSVWVVVPTAPSGSPTSGDTPVTCPAVVYARTVSASLAAPLRERALVDAATGSTFRPVLTSSLLVPTPMPDGWRLRGESGQSASSPAGTLPLLWSQTFGPWDGAGVQVVMSWGGPCEGSMVGPGTTPVTIRGVEGFLRPPGMGGATLLWREGEACVAVTDLSAGPAAELLATAGRLAPSTRAD